MSLEIDATFIALLALILFGALLVWLKVPAMIAGMLDSGSQAIAKELSEARRLREEAERLLAEYQAKKVEAEAEAQALVASAKEQAAAVAEETRKQMTEAIARRQKQAEDSIAQAEAQASAQVRAAAVDAAVAAAEAMLKSQIDAGAQSKLVAKGVSELAGKFN